MYVPLRKIIQNAILRYRKIFIVSRTFHVYSQECSVKRQKLRFYLQIYVLICESLCLLTDKVILATEMSSLGFP